RALLASRKQRQAFLPLAMRHKGPRRRFGKTTVRIFVVVISVLVLVGGLISVKASQIGLLIKTGKAAQAAGPPPEVVASAEAKTETWLTRLYSVGNVSAGRGVAISNDAPGLVTRIYFESGDQVKAGAPLVELDTGVERAQLASSQARLELAQTTLARTQALAAEGIATGAELDTAKSTLKSLQAEVAALRAQIARKVIHAPFSGKLGIRSVNLGQYLSPGTALTTLQSDEAEYVDFSLPQEHLEQLRVGLPVELSADASDIRLEGVVAAIEPEVDQVTRAVKLRASAQDPKDRLRPGMFINVKVILDEKREVVTVPVTAVVYAPYGDSVFLIERDPKNPKRSVAQQQFVRLGETRGDFVEVEEGLKGGVTVVSAGAFKLRNGLPVVINNKVKPEPKLNPNPANR